MKTLLKFLGGLFVLLVIFILAGVGYLKIGLPNIEAHEVNLDIQNQSKVQYGEYLANHVAACMDCHSQRDWTKFAGPLNSETFGAGGEAFTRDMGLPGNYYSKNITPAGIGNWTDGELYRAITSGVNKDGEALFNIMPYGHYGTASKDDIEAIMVYLRNLQPITSEIPQREMDFPVSLLINTFPTEPDHTPRPDKSNKLEYGKYLVNLAACYDCHTPFASPGSYDESLGFAGGMEFQFPNGNIVRSANITPDAETGIGGWSEEMFIQQFKQYGGDYTPPAVDPDGYNTTMPWLMYADMHEEDLAAIYTYLKSLKPLKNQVTKFTPAGS